MRHIPSKPEFKTAWRLPDQAPRQKFGLQKIDGLKSISAFLSLLLVFSCATSSLAWDGNWTDAPSGDFLYDTGDSQGKSGVSPDPQTFYTPVPRDYADVDPEELKDYYGRGRRPDYSPYALARITQDLRFGKDITIPAGYYLIKAGDAGDGSPKAHDPQGASGDKSLQQTGSKRKTGGPARPTGSMDPGAYPDTTGFMALWDETNLIAQTLPELDLTQTKKAAAPIKTAPRQTIGAPATESQTSDATPANPTTPAPWQIPDEDAGRLKVMPSLEGLDSMSLPEDPNAIQAGTQTAPILGKHSAAGPIRKLLPPSLFDPYSPTIRSRKAFLLPQVFIFKKLGRVVAVVPIQRIERHVLSKTEHKKIPPHPLVWIDNEDGRLVMRMYDRQLLYTTYFN